MEKKYDHSIGETHAQQLWKTKEVFSIKNNNGPLYSIDTPPPTVSGSLHIGHIFSYTQTDIIARYKRMRGYSVFYPFGFDDNGLATERFVEKKRDIKGYELPRSEFISICLQETQLAEQGFKTLWQRMGISADWSKTYSTISEQTRRLSQASFIELLEKNYIYRKNEPALYCATCRTSVAQAELDDKELPSFFNDIIFKDEQGNDLIIGTTRPELLPSCVALLYNPSDERYKHLHGKQAVVPIFNTRVPILEDEMVSIEKGTGLVMCCTFGDKTDIEWFKKFNLPYKPSIGFNGKWLEHTGILAGLSAHQARLAVLEELKHHNLVIAQKPIVHAVNIHERCKKEIEYVLLQQWFVAVLPYKKDFIARADEINWYPGFMKSRYVNWVENLGWDWCISRQRFFGIPFPVWHCRDCGAILVANIQDLPVDPQETPYNGPCTQCNGSNIIPDTDVMDTWNTSSITPYICGQLYHDSATLPWKASDAFIPMTLRPQAHDIIRTWAFYTIVKTEMHQKTIPWKDIVISGHVLSDQKDKLSKSAADQKALTPERLLEQYPADAVRYWTASGGLGHDIAFSENQLKIGLRLITKLWNAFWFTKEHVQAVDAQSKPTVLGMCNEWLLHQASHCFEQYQKQLELHEFSAALNSVEQFFWHDFCDNYLELIKNQLFNPQEYDAATVAATQWTLYHVGLRILQMYAPYMPHITEAIYQELYKKNERTESLHQTRFETVQTRALFEESAQAGQMVIAIAEQVRKAKTEKQLSLKTALAELTIYAQNIDQQHILEPVAQIIRGVTQAQKVTFTLGIKETPEITKDAADNWHAQLGI